VPHSATPLRDETDRTEAALDLFRRYGARTWIDHQPYTNCEALVNQGYQSGPYSIAAPLHKYGYAYAWSGIDATAGPLNLLSPIAAGRYSPVLWSAGRLSSGMEDDLWLFRTMMMYVDAQRFFQLYGAQPLDRLERERGLHIAHTYLEAFHPPSSPLVKRNLMLPGKHTGEVIIHPRLQKVFADLAARVERGTLWVPTLGQLADHTRAMLGVQVRLNADGSAAVLAAQNIPSATFVLPRPNLQILANGQPVRGIRSTSHDTTFWLPLPAGKPVRMTLFDSAGNPLPFWHGADGKPFLARLAKK
jgi:hypothetical protein